MSKRTISLPVNMTITFESPSNRFGEELSYTDNDGNNLDLTLMEIKAAISNGEFEVNDLHIDHFTHKGEHVLEVEIIHE